MSLQRKCVDDMAKKIRKHEEEDDSKRLAALLRGLKPKQRSHYHSPAKQGEVGVQKRRHSAQELNDLVRKYNAGEEIEDA